MKIIEKITDDGDSMFFEKMSRKDVGEMINDYYTNEYALNHLKDFDDIKLYWELEDGAIGFFDENTISKRPAIAKIKKFHAENGASAGFFGKGIDVVENDDYGDFELAGY